MCGDVERGRCGRSCGCRGRRNRGTRVLVLKFTSAARFVLAEYARDRERRIRRRGRLDRGRRFATAAVGRVPRRGRRRSGRRATAVGRAAAAVAARRPRVVVVVVVAGHVDSRRLGHDERCDSPRSETAKLKKLKTQRTDDFHRFRLRHAEIVTILRRCAYNSYTKTAPTVVTFASAQQLDHDIGIPKILKSTRTV